MPRGRGQFTLRWLMGVVAVVGFEAFLYTSIAQRNAMVNPNASLRENLVQFLMGSMLYGVLFSRIRPAISTASNQGDQGEAMP